MPLSEILSFRVLQCKSSRLEFQCGLNDNEVDDLIKLLKQRPDIINLQLNQNNLSDVAIFKFLKELPYIKIYNFDGNNIGDQGAKALVLCSAIRRLDLSNNRSITSEAWQVIAETNQQDLLIVEGNHITEESKKKIEERTKLNKEKFSQSIESKTESNPPSQSLESSKKNTPSSSVVTGPGIFRKNSDSHSDSEIGSIEFHNDLNSPDSPSSSKK